MSTILKTAALFLIGFVMTFSGSSQTNITRVEYYLDTDPGYGLAPAVSITASPTVSTSFTINTGNLNQGMHVAGVRSRDANGKWSFDEIWLLFKSAPVTLATNINQAEWYIDDDLGYGKATPVSVTSPGTDKANLSFASNLSNLSSGMHVMGVRSRNASGVWSFDEQWLLFKSAPPASIANISKAEWYIDTDPGYDKATSITPLAPGILIANLSFPVTVNKLSNGMHVIGVRSRDATGAWSLDEQWLLFKSVPPVTATNLKRIEYYIDKDPGYGKGFPLAFNASRDINPLLSFINATGQNSGNHKFMVRSQDMNGAWSFDDSLVFTIDSSKAAPFISINSLAFTNSCAAGPFTIGYHATGTINAGNQFIAELSNATGDFSNATQLATPLNSSSTGGLINCVMPPNIQKGTGYRMRVRSTNPALTSNQNTLSISVDKAFLGKDTAFLLLCAESGFDLTQVYNTANSDVLWSVSNPTSAPVGIHTLFATNAIGCKDTAIVTLTQKLANWTGNISSDWHNPLNWSPQNVPDSETTVMVGFNIIPAKPCIVSNKDAEVYQIRVQNGLNAYYVQVNSNRKIIIRGNCKLPK